MLCTPQIRLGNVCKPNFIGSSHFRSSRRAHAPGNAHDDQGQVPPHGGRRDALPIVGRVYEPFDRLLDHLFRRAPSDQLRTHEFARCAGPGFERRRESGLGVGITGTPFAAIVSPPAHRSLRRATARNPQCQYLKFAPVLSNHDDRARGTSSVRELRVAPKQTCRRLALACFNAKAQRPTRSCRTLSGGAHFLKASRRPPSTSRRIGWRVAHSSGTPDQPRLPTSTGGHGLGEPRSHQA